MKDMKKRIQKFLDQLKGYGHRDNDWPDNLIYKDSHFFFSEVVHNVIENIEDILNEGNEEPYTDDTDPRVFDISSVQVGTDTLLKDTLTMRQLSVLPIYFERTDEIEAMVVEDWFTYAEGGWANIIRRTK